MDKMLAPYSSNWRRYVSLLLVVVLLLPLVAVAPVHAPSVAGNVQPLLLQMAAAQPEARVGVIVQKTDKSNRLEERVAELGGTVTSDLHIINAFAAKLPGKAVTQLAQAEGVRWVSFDAPAVSSAIEQAAPLNATSVTLSLSPVKDTYITAVGTLGSTTNFGTCNSLGLANTLGSPAIYRRPLLMFDLSAIPAGATILSASMDLYASYVDHAGTVNVHRVTSDWDEGTASCATNGIANWASRKAGSVAWTTPGGDYDPAVAASVAASAVGAYHFDLTALAQNWANGAYPNYGVLLEQPTQAGYGEISWQSKETFAPAQAPKLQVVYTTDPTYVTWATQLGTVASTTFSDSSAMVDSALGANGTYGSGDRVTGSFAGFASEVTPGNAISKVWLVLHGYAATSFVKSVKLSIYVSGTLASQVTAPGSIFNNVVGSSKAGPVYVDLTGTRAWQWADFDKDLQVVIDQSAVDKGNVMTYDAVACG